MSSYSLARSSISDSNGEKNLPVVPQHKWIIARSKLRLKRLTRYWWSWELLAASLSDIATMTLLVILGKADGQAQHSFQIANAELTLNTIVAAISTIIRTSLLVSVAGALNQSMWNWFSRSQRDGQRRGMPLDDLNTFGDAANDSWSSLRLLWRTKFKTLASLGALITILSLAFDAFTQQVLSLEARRANPADDRAYFSSSLSRASSYVGVFEGDAVAPLGVQAAMMAGVFNVEVPPPASVCAADSCSWPTTPTIGVCSTCDDVRQSMTKNTSSTSFGYSLFRKYATIPDSLFLDDARSGLDIDSTSVTFQFDDDNTALNISAMRGDALGNLTASNQLIISRFYQLGVPPRKLDDLMSLALSSSSPSESSVDDLMVAYNCTIYFCLQALSSPTNSHIAQETQLSTWDQMRTLQALEGSNDGAEISEKEATWSFTNIPASMNVANASAYQVDCDSLAALQKAFLHITNGNVTSGLHSYLRNSSALNSSDLGLTVASDGVLRGIGSTVQSFWNASDTLETMSALCANIANSLTTYIRATYPAAPDARYAPQDFDNETVVVVRWAWLPFPLTVVLAGQVFLAATIVQTKRRRARPWKGHRVPLLLARVDESVREWAKGGLESRTGLEERVGGLRVRMEYEGEEIAFRRMV